MFGLLACEKPPRSFKPSACLPMEMCQEKGLEAESTTNPRSIGSQDGSKVAGTGTFKAMAVAKSLLSVARLVNKGKYVSSQGTPT